MKVRRMWTTDDKEPTDALLSMSSFYGFDFRFCNARSGNEKGNVEESVKFVRKYVFFVRDEFDSLGEAQNYLSAGCAKLNTKATVRLRQTSSHSPERTLMPCGPGRTT